jgi:hypothetical protein
VGAAGYHTISKIGLDKTGAIMFGKTSHAGKGIKGAVDFQHIPRTCPVVKSIDILGNDRVDIAFLLKPFHRLVGRVRLCAQHVTGKRVQPGEKLLRLVAESA